MSGGLVQATAESWSKAAVAFEESGSGAVGDISSLLTETTNPGTCGAAEGLATVDGAVAMMLTVFDSVMRSEVLESLQDGFAHEVETMHGTAEAIALMEEEAAGLAEGAGQ